MKLKINSNIHGRSMCPAVYEIEENDPAQKVDIDIDKMIDILESYKRLDFSIVSLFVEEDKPVLVTPAMDRSTIDKYIVGIALSPILE